MSRKIAGLLVCYWANMESRVREISLLFFKIKFFFFKTLQDFISHHYWRSHSVSLGVFLDAAIHVMDESHPYSEVICIPLYPLYEVYSELLYMFLFFSGVGFQSDTQCLTEAGSTHCKLSTPGTALDVFT